MFASVWVSWRLLNSPGVEPCDRMQWRPHFPPLSHWLHMTACLYNKLNHHTSSCVPISALSIVVVPCTNSLWEVLSFGQEHLGTSVCLLSITVAASPISFLWYQMLWCRSPPHFPILYVHFYASVSAAPRGVEPGKSVHFLELALLKAPGGGRWIIRSSGASRTHWICNHLRILSLLQLQTALAAIIQPIACLSVGAQTSVNSFVYRVPFGACFL